MVQNPLLLDKKQNGAIHTSFRLVDTEQLTFTVNGGREHPGNKVTFSLEAGYASKEYGKRIALAFQRCAYLDAQKQETELA